MRASGGSPEDVDELLDRMEQTYGPGSGIVTIAVVAGELVAVGRLSVLIEVAEASATRLRVGVGRPVPTEQVGVSYRTAGLAMEGAHAGGAPVLWKERLAQGVSALLDPDTAQSFADATLANLREPTDADLLATLASFLRHHGSHARIARDLGIHRNTVTLRVRLLESRLERSLDDPQTRVDAWVALQIANAAHEGAAFEV